MFVQKRFGTEIEVDFRTEHICYRFRNRSGAFQHNVPYEGISNDRLEREDRSEYFRNVGIFLLLMSLIDWLAGARGIMLWGWLILGAGGIAYYYLSTIKFTVIPADGVALLVIRDKDHDRLIREIVARRNTYLKAKYGKVNTENDREREIAKFAWLRRLGAISQEEFDEVNLSFLFGRPEP